MLSPAPFLIAGIVNVTPDSFHDGGLYADPDAAVAHGLKLAAQGAHMLDIGGESTRPFAHPLPAEEEMARVEPVVRELALALGNQAPGSPSPDSPAPDSPAETPGTVPVISVDTYKAVVAEAAINAGAAVVNDVSAGIFDPPLIDILAHYRPGYVLMHSLGRPQDMQRAPRYQDVVSEILSFFEVHLARLIKAGLPEEHIVLDPGIGFGKALEHNLAILANIERFMELGRPVYMGLSNKSLWAGLLGLGAGERGGATQAATAVLAWRGVAIHRVHDVAATRVTLGVVEGLIKAC